jgi:hypothetical protein
LRELDFALSGPNTTFKSNTGNQFLVIGRCLGSLCESGHLIRYQSDDIWIGLTSPTGEMGQFFSGIFATIFDSSKCQRLAQQLLHALLRAFETPL